MDSKTSIPRKQANDVELRDDILSLHAILNKIVHIINNPIQSSRFSQNKHSSINK